MITRLSLDESARHSPGRATVPDAAPTDIQEWHTMPINPIRPESHPSDDKRITGKERVSSLGRATASSDPRQAPPRDTVSISLQAAGHAQAGFRP